MKDFTVGSVVALDNVPYKVTAIAKTSTGAHAVIDLVHDVPKYPDGQEMRVGDVYTDGERRYTCYIIGFEQGKVRHISSVISGNPEAYDFLPRPLAKLLFRTKGLS